MRHESVSNPFDFSLQPVFNEGQAVQRLIDESREARLNTQFYNAELADKQFKVRMAELSVFEADAKLKAIRAELSHLSQL